MDEYKKCSLKEIGLGGINCPCCGPAPGKERKEMRRRIRRRMKQEFRRSLRRNDDDTSKM